MAKHQCTKVNFKKHLSYVMEMRMLGDVYASGMLRNWVGGLANLNL